jgi:hypothetical protein
MYYQVLRLVSLPIWHGLSHGRLQLELAAQPALAKRWKALLKKEAKAAAGGSKSSKKKDKRKGKAAAAAADGDAAAGDAAAAAADAGGEAAETAAAAAAELPSAEASFLPGMIQEFLSVLRAADAQLAGLQQQQQQQQQPQAVADAEEEQEAEEDEEEEEEHEAENAAAEDAAGDADAAENALTTAEDAAAANGHQQQGGRRQQQQGRKQQQQRKRSARNKRNQVKQLLLRHLERFVEWLIDLLSQLPTRRFVHALLEDQQLLVKVRPIRFGCATLLMLQKRFELLLPGGFCWDTCLTTWCMLLCWSFVTAACADVSYKCMRPALCSCRLLLQSQHLMQTLLLLSCLSSFSAGSPLCAVCITWWSPVQAAAGPAVLLLRLPTERSHRGAAQGG